MFLLAASNAASFARFAKSAPEKPGVPLAITEISTLVSPLGASGFVGSAIIVILFTSISGAM